MKFSDVKEGEVFLYNGEPLKRIRPTHRGLNYKNAISSDGTLYYVYDDGKNIIESIEE